MISLSQKINNGLSKSYGSSDNTIEKSAKSFVPFRTFYEEKNTREILKTDRVVPPNVLRKMYRNNPVVFTCVNTIVNEIVSARWAVVPVDRERTLTSEEKTSQ